MSAPASRTWKLISVLPAKRKTKCCCQGAAFMAGFAGDQDVKALQHHSRSLCNAVSESQTKLRHGGCWVQLARRCIKHHLKKAEMCCTGLCWFFCCLQIKPQPDHMTGQTAVYSAVCFVYSSTMPWHKPCVNRWRLSARRFIAANWSHHCTHAGRVGSRACALVTNSLTAGN